jgi:GH24 family phage-related lysozyme (muramidase)
MSDTSERFKNLRKRFEGYSEEVYPDEKGIPTVGSGINLNSPEVSEILNDMGYDVEAIKRGVLQLSPSELEEISKIQDQEKRRYLQTIQKKDFPNYKPTENELNALMLLMSNSPQLIGPNLRDKLNKNDRFGAFDEIINRSNKYKTPGVQYRRMQEASEFAGEKTPEYFQRLPTSQIDEMRNILEQTENPGHLEDMKKKFPQIWQK